MLKLFTIISIVLAGSVQALFDASNKKVEYLTDSNFEEMVIKSNEPWMIKFYAPWCGHCKNLAPSWEKAAKALKGVVRVGAIDVDTFKQTGSKYGVQGFPSIKYFGLNKKNSPQDYSGARDANAIVNYALDQTAQQVRKRIGAKGDSGSSSGGQKKQGGGQQQGGGSGGNDDVVVLDEDNFDTLVLQSKDIWIVEFYAPWCGHCKQLEPEYESAARKLKGQVKLGKVDADDQRNKGLAARFGVQGFPTIKYWNYGLGKTDSQALDYNGERTASGIVSFASDLADKADIEPELHEVIKQSVYDNNCKGPIICVIAFLPNIYDSNAKERNNYLSTIKKVSKKNRKHSFEWFWLSAGDQLDLERDLGLGFGYPAFVAISPTKKMIATMRSSFSSDNLNEFLSDLLIGRGGLANLPGPIKIKKAEAWNGEDAPPLEDDSYLYEDL